LTFYTLFIIIGLGYGKPNRNTKTEL